MYLEIHVADATTSDDGAGSSYGGSSASTDTPGDAEERRERLIALLRCAYGWGRVRALQQVTIWLALDAEQTHTPGRDAWQAGARLARPPGTSYTLPAYDHASIPAPWANPVGF